MLWEVHIILAYMLVGCAAVVLARQIIFGVVFRGEGAEILIGPGPGSFW